MIELLIVGDGPGDTATVPHLVGRILGVNVRATFKHWARIHREGSGKGYRKKLLFAMRQAVDADATGLVMTVDVDNDPQGRKLKELCNARDEARQSAPAFPTAFGEANVHAEAWLLDDRVAVRQGLRLVGGHPIPNVRDVDSPKEELEQLRRQSERCADSISAVLTDIARLVEPSSSRCPHWKETGFHRFAEEVRQELGPLVKQCGSDCPGGDACVCKEQPRAGEV
ncbi:MAG TPA: hypothetical protein VKA46_13125 [Gemmataceae bacterium]|nr:hypothetical protein [Gemmataceae bacterium]